MVADTAYHDKTAQLRLRIVQSYLGSLLTGLDCGLDCTVRRLFSEGVSYAENLPVPARLVQTKTVLQAWL